MKKNVLVNNLIFKFYYREDSGFWYLNSDEFDIFKLGYSTNITIYKKNIDWIEVEKFLTFITSDIQKIRDKIDVSNIKLKEYFKEFYKSIEPDFNYKDIFFTLCNIDYEGVILNNGIEVFNYTMNFNVESKSDEGFFTYDSWNTMFRDDDFITLSKS